MNQSGPMDPAEVGDAVSSMREQVVQAVQQASEKLELERRMKEDPWSVIGVAAGAGFILGGGLWTVLRPILKTAGRAMLSPSNLLAIGAAVGALRAAQSRAQSSGSAGSQSGGGKDDPMIVVPATH